ncbi:hypothetical protein QR680_003323 [Steinernema hermaphroditum]|uniref:Uncharacterized protein n=1 Tax=Steinernema hermaphroditum TaxID=289476 RepID=A0AA39H8W6_9BILA|nr:hypothetical protein QR680_003323 [Steinernema hermaphroditum]
MITSLLCPASHRLESSQKQSAKESAARGRIFLVSETQSYRGGELFSSRLRVTLESDASHRILVCMLSPLVAAPEAVFAAQRNAHFFCVFFDSCCSPLAIRA